MGSDRLTLVGVERVVLDAAADALRRDTVTLDDDFLGLGGESLAATMLAAAIEDATGVVVSIATILDSERLADLAELVVESQSLGVS